MTYAYGRFPQHWRWSKAMFIIGDEGCKHNRIPWMTGSLILLNLLAFGLQKWIGDPVTYGFSLVPAEITQLKDFTTPKETKMVIPVARPHPRYPHIPEFDIIELKETTVSIPQYPGPFPIFLTLITSMFLHGDWVHLIGNMWFLIIFGRNVESVLNHGRFLLFYIGCGVAG